MNNRHLLKLWPSFIKSNNYTYLTYLLTILLVNDCVFTVVDSITKVPIYSVALLLRNVCYKNKTSNNKVSNAFCMNRNKFCQP